MIDDAYACERGGQTVRPIEIAHNKLRPTLAQQAGAVGRANQAPDGHAALGERLDQMRTDKSGSTGDQCEDHTTRL